MDLLVIVGSYIVVWALVFFILLPIRLQTQSEAGEVAYGTSGSSPQRHHLKRKAWITTLVAALVWGLVAWIILAEIVTLEDIDLFSRFGPGSGAAHGQGG